MENYKKTQIEGIAVENTISGTITEANVINVVDNMIIVLTKSSIGKNILNAGNLVLYMNYDNYNALIRALRRVNYFHTNIGQGGEFDFPGKPVKIIAVKSLPSTKMLLYDGDIIYNPILESDLVLSSDYIRQYIRDQKLNKLLNDNS